MLQPRLPALQPVAAAALPAADHRRARHRAAPPARRLAARRLRDLLQQGLLRWATAMWTTLGRRASKRCGWVAGNVCGEVACRAARRAACPPVLAPSTVQPTLLQVRDAVFLHGYNEPVLVLLHEAEPTWAGNLRQKVRAVGATAAGGCRCFGWPRGFCVVEPCAKAVHVSLAKPPGLPACHVTPPCLLPFAAMRRRTRAC